MIQLREVSKAFHTKAGEFSVLKNISLTIEKGESVAIMGKSGVGKSTLLQILGCLDTFDTGDYYFQEIPIRGKTDTQLAALRNRSMGFVLQDFALINQKTALFHAMLPMLFDKTPIREMKGLALAALGKVGMEALAKKKVGKLSGGQKQRVAIARAIVKNPELILADEPTGALDGEATAEIMELLLERNRAGATLLVVTHDEAVASYCKRRILLQEGEIMSDELSDSADRSSAN